MSRPPSVDTGKLLELRRVQGLTYEEIGHVVGLAPSGVYERLKRLESILPEQNEVEIYRSRRADVLSGLQAGLVARVADCLSDETERAKISPYQAVGMFGILYDKERLETGKSTSNIATLTKIVESAQDSGDSALRNISIDASKPKLPNP